MLRSPLLLILGSLYAAGAIAAPRAESAMECGIAADMAVVAHSLAKERIQQPQASAIMARIYDVSESERGKEMMKDIIAAAYVKTDAKGSEATAASGGTSGSTAAAVADGRSGQKFAEELLTTCLKTGGNLDTVLGKRL
jgi:hypothetical protein